MKATYHGNELRDPLFYLCLPIILVYIAGEIAWAWLKRRFRHSGEKGEQT